MIDAAVAPPSKRASLAAQHLSTDHLASDLRGHALRGALITIIAQILKLAVQMGSTAVLARLLDPADFGLVAMATAITGFIWIFSDLGLSVATVQRENISHEQVNALFWISVASGALLTFLGLSLAPIIAWFFAEPRLTIVVDFLSVTFLLGGITAQHYSLIVRQMRFGAAALVQVGAALVGAAIGVTFALLGSRYWSLVAMTLGTSLAAAGFCWLLSRWRPSRPRRSVGMRSLLAFGGAMTAAKVIQYLVQNLDNVIIGRVSGPNALGLYSKAYGLVLLPVRQIYIPITGVIVPVLSRLQNDSVRYRRYFTHALAALVLVSMPLLSIAFLTANDLVLVMLGPKWLAATPLFQVLAIGAFASTLTSATEWVLISSGRANRLLFLSAGSAPIVIASFFVGILWGPRGVAVGFSSVTCALVPVMYWRALTQSPITFGDLARAVWRPFSASTFAAIVLAFASTRWGSLPTALDLVIKATLYLTVYLLVMLLLPGGRAHISHSIDVIRRKQRLQ